MHNAHGAISTVKLGNGASWAKRGAHPARTTLGAINHHTAPKPAVNVSGLRLAKLRQRVKQALAPVRQKVRQRAVFHHVQVAMNMPCAARIPVKAHACAVGFIGALSQSGVIRFISGRGGLSLNLTSASLSSSLTYSDWLTRARRCKKFRKCHLRLSLTHAGHKRTSCDTVHNLNCARHTPRSKKFVSRTANKTRRVKAMALLACAARATHNLNASDARRRKFS
jgi:hypothetical protein